MALLTPAPTTALGRAVREERDAAREARRHNSWWRRVVKGIAVLAVALWGAVGIGSGTAQAGWPWEDLVTAVYYICGPMDVPQPVTYQGFDTSLGLNHVENSDQRGTIVPRMQDGMGDEGNGLDRLRKQFSGDDYNTLAKPTYERYGFNSLVWTNYGNGCASKSFWLSGVTNFAFDIFVKFPMILGMGLLNLAMTPNNPLYAAFALIIQPVISVFTAIFTPWIFFIAPIGVFLIWVKTRSTMQVTKAFIWVVCIYGVFLWMGNNTSTVVTKANNFVTEFAGSAACKISEAGAGGQACDPNNPMGNIHQSLWHGIPYQTWMAGELGERAASQARADEEAGKIGWGPAILNGLYVGVDSEGRVDAKGREVSRAITWWNSASYASNTDADAKVGYWTGGNSKLPDWSKGTAWEDVPFLANVKFMCNDKVTDGDGSDSADDNRWMYGGQCDTAGAGTSDMAPYFKGEGYSQQIVYAFAGMWAVIAIVLTIGLACIYLMLQKMLFYWLLAFGPLFLAISTFADEKRRQFAKRYFELLVANVIKQCVAVCLVLFVSYSMSTLLFPPPDSEIPEIPWIVKPYAAIIFMIALIMFAKPMSNIMTGAVKGDVSVVDKAATAPQRAAANTAKAAALAGAVAATGGVAAAAAPGVLSGMSVSGAASSLASNPQALRGLGRMAGRGLVGKGLHGAAAIAGWRKDLAGSAANKEGQARAVQDAAQHLIGADPDGKKYARDKDGNVTAAGRKAAETDAQRMIAAGQRETQAQTAAKQSMDRFFAGYKAQHGEAHPDDPATQKNGHKAAEPQGEQTPGRPVSEQMADRAREAHSGPSYARDPDQQVVAAETGESVLSGLDLTLTQVVNDPSALVTGGSYAGGHTERMDPNHGAFEALTALRFALDSGSDADVQRVGLDASSAIASAGSVPAHVEAAHSTGDLAAQWSPAQTVGAMPDLSPAEDGTPVGWEDRAAGAVTMARAAALMPEGHEARPAVDAYLSALSTPSVDLGAVDVLGVAAIQALIPPGGGDGDGDGGGSPPPPPSGSAVPPAYEPPVDATNGHDPAGLGLAREALRKVGEAKASQNGDRPGAPSDDSEPPRDVPRGEGDGPVAEYNNPTKKKRSGIFDYDDENGGQS